VLREVGQQVQGVTVVEGRSLLRGERDFPGLFDVMDPLEGDGTSSEVLEQGAEPIPVVRVNPGLNMYAEARAVDRPGLHGGCRLGAQ